MHNFHLQPEGKTLEFKRDLSSPKPLLKTLVAFANTAGGRLIVGVADDRQVLGVANALDDEERLCSLIADGIAPRLVPNVEMITVEGKTLLVVEVFVSGLRPHWLKAEGPEQGVYVRLGSTSRQADQALIDELRRTADGVAFDELPMPELSLDDLDMVAARKLFQGINALDEQALRTLDDRLVALQQARAASGCDLGTLGEWAYFFIGAAVLGLLHTYVTKCGVPAEFFLPERCALPLRRTSCSQALT